MRPRKTTVESKPKPIDEPRKYNIHLNQPELKALNDLIKTIEQDPLALPEKFSKKKNKFKYSLIKASDDKYFIIGSGKAKGLFGQKNAFLGAGDFGRAKTIVQLAKDNNQHYTLSNVLYVVKIIDLRKNKINTTSVKVAAGEVNFFNQVNGGAELIVNKDATKAYMVMPKLHDVEIHNMKIGHLTPKEFANVMIAALKAVADMHKKGVFHNDIKADNIFYDYQNQKSFLTDFGSSRATQEVLQSKGGKSSDITKLKTMLVGLLNKYLENHITKCDFAADYKIDKSDVGKELINLLEPLQDKDKQQIKLAAINDEFIKKLNNLFEKITIVLTKNSFSERRLATYSKDLLVTLLNKAITSDDKEVFAAVFGYCKKKLSPEDIKELFITALVANEKYYLDFLIKHTTINPDLVFLDLINRSALDKIKPLVVGKLVNNINIRDSNAKTPLIITAEAMVDATAITLFLLAKGAAINSTDNKGKTALMYAIESDNTNIALCLIQQGADVEIIANDDTNAKKLAELNDNEKVLVAIKNKTNQNKLLTATEEGNTKIVRDLLEQHVDPNFSIDKSTTPLLIAVKNWHPALIELLVTHGANPNFYVEAEDGQSIATPLLLAFAKGDLDTAAVLVHFGAQLNVCNQQGYTPLMLAIEAGNKHLTQLMLDNHALPTNGALLLAIKQGDKNVVDYALKNGVSLHIKPSENIHALLKSAVVMRHHDLSKQLLGILLAKENTALPRYNTIRMLMNASDQQFPQLANAFLTLEQAAQAQATQTTTTKDVINKRISAAYLAFNHNPDRYQAIITNLEYNVAHPQTKIPKPTAATKIKTFTNQNTKIPQLKLAPNLFNVASKNVSVKKPVPTNKPKK